MNSPGKGSDKRNTDGAVASGVVVVDRVVVYGVAAPTRGLAAGAAVVGRGQVTHVVPRIARVAPPKAYRWSVCRVGQARRSSHDLYRYRNRNRDRLSPFVLSA